VSVKVTLKNCGCETKHLMRPSFKDPSPPLAFLLDLCPAHTMSFVVLLTWGTTFCFRSVSNVRFSRSLKVVVGGGVKGGLLMIEDVDDECRWCVDGVTNESEYFSKTKPLCCNALLTVLRLFAGTRM